MLFLQVVLLSAASATAQAIASSAATAATSATSVSCRSEVCQFRLFDRNGTECIKVDLSGVRLRVQYRCNNFTAVCEARVAMPTGSGNATVSGHCGNRTAAMTLAWSAGRFQLQMEFQQQTFYSSQIMTSIDAYNFVGHLKLVVDLRDSAFANASLDLASPVENFVSSQKFFLFAAPVGMDFLCRSPETSRLRSGRQQQLEDGAEEPITSEITFSSVRLEAFRSSAPVGGLLEGPFLCEADSNKQARSVTILVISGLLGVCMLVIVCGFLATRLNKDSGYSSME